MFKTMLYTHYLTKAEKLVKKGVSIDDERVKRLQKKIRKIVYDTKEP